MVRTIRRREALAALAGMSSYALIAHARADAQKAILIPAGDWIEVPNTRLEDVFPPREGHPAWARGPHMVTSAWGGGAFDSRREVLVLTGGGHTDYGGNEVYEFHVGLLRWIRATEPSPMRALGGGKFETLGSEAPVSSHTYDGLVYLPNVDRVFKFGGSYYSLGFAYDPHAYLYSVEQRTWKRGAPAPIPCIEAACDYDAKVGCAVVSCGAGLMFYHPQSDAWQVGPQSSGWSSASCAAIDTHNRLFVQTMSTTGELQYFDLDNPRQRMKTAVAGMQPWGAHPGMIYHPHSRRLVIWGGNRDIWLVRTSDWSTTLITPRYGPSGPERHNGIYGRWQYMPRYDAFIGYSRSSDNVWMFRLPT